MTISSPIFSWLNSKSIPQSVNDFDILVEVAGPTYLITWVGLGLFAMQMHKKQLCREEVVALVWH